MLLIPMLVLWSATVFPAAPSPEPPPVGPPTGEVRLTRAWTADVGGARGTVLVDVHLAGDVVLVADAAGGVTALERADGSLRWFVQLGGPLSMPPSPGGGQLVLADDTDLVVVDAATGKRLMHAELAAPLAASPVSDGERIYLPLLAGRRVSVVSVATGREVWDIRTPDTASGAALLVNGVVVLTSLDGSVRGVRSAGRASPDAEIWVRQEGRLVGDVARQGDHLFVATESRSVLALDGASGRVLWKNIPGGLLLGGPLAAGPVVVVQTSEGTVGLAADSGRELWRMDSVAPLAAVPGSVIVRSEYGAGAVLDPEDGSVVLDGVPGELRPASPFLITVEDDRLLVAWRLSEI